LAVALASLSRGGHLRVGMEDTLTLSRGVPVTHNEQLVSRAAALAELAQRPAMSVADAREFLKVKQR
jgi:3-keto-5-aminohexanoate cleavage enzyme